MYTFVYSLYVFVFMFEDIFTDIFSSLQVFKYFQATQQFGHWTLIRLFHSYLPLQQDSLF